MPFLTPLIARHERLNDGKWWILDEDLVYQLIGAEQIKIVVPKGFRTDGPTVPRLPGVYLFFANEFIEAAVIHDWLYRTGITSRIAADGLLREMIIESGYEPYFAQYVYYGVRIGGWKIWKEYRRKEREN